VVEPPVVLLPAMLVLPPVVEVEPPEPPLLPEGHTQASYVPSAKQVCEPMVLPGHMQPGFLLPTVHVPSSDVLLIVQFVIKSPTPALAKMSFQYDRLLFIG